MNEFYNNKSFQLVKVKFSPSSRPYTYATHKKLNLKVNDMVVVLAGNDLQLPKDYESLKVVKVVDITNNLKHISTDYELKHVVCKVQHNLHDKLEQMK